MDFGSHLAGKKYQCDKIIIIMTSRTHGKLKMTFLNRPYSGMWWVSRDVFRNKWTGHCTNLEGVSFSLFNNVGLENVYMTKDWLDFSVEHLSHYFKGISLGILSNFQVIVTKFSEYLTNVRQISIPNADRSAFHNTLAVLPMYLEKTDKLCGSDMLLENVHVGDRLQCLYMYALSATLTSLWQVGIQRVLIPVNFVEQPASINEAIRLFRSSGSGRDESTMEIVHINVTEIGNGKNIPSDAMDLLFLAFNGSMPDSELMRWVGPRDQRDQWKSIYFSEPDLILHTRSPSIWRLTKTIEDGKVMAAHRLHPLPHAVDFPDDNINVLNKYIPNYGNWSNFSGLEVQGGGSCCDAGNWWPGKDDYPHCGNFFSLCGYNRNPTNVEEAINFHKRLAPYPRIRLIDGMNVPLISEHGRVCVPPKSGRCDS